MTVALNVSVSATSSKAMSNGAGHQPSPSIGARVPCAPLTKPLCVLDMEVISLGPDQKIISHEDTEPYGLILVLVAPPSQRDLSLL